MSGPTPIQRKIQKRKKYGHLHPSGLNRHQRREAAARERGAKVREWKQKRKDAWEYGKDLIAMRVTRREETAHQKTLARKAIVK